MISRVADTMYWMNRYIERAENYARFMDVNFNLSLELPPEVSEQWKPLVDATGDWALYESLYGDAEKSKVIYFLGFDIENQNSIYNSIVKARENARAIRPEITKELWEQINFLYYLVKEGLTKKLWKKNDPRKFFLKIRKGCQLFYGIMDTTISRNDGWHFGRIGQLIERADKTSRVLDVKYHILLPTQESIGSPLDLIQWTALLKSVSAYDMYRKKNGKLTPIGISGFLILDREFPRSMMQCLTRAEQSLYKITGSDDGFSNEAEKKLKILKSKLNYADINEIFQTGLHEYLDTFQKELNQVSTAFYNSFFCSESIINQNQNTQQ
ncbi:alpha-E domain-containing protein [Flavivirga amylovorans]|uniref:Alpha-E domain-containing protein n=1 Tax=Flavivirga amylovorans TaxID=870486 RepID=A0ABT8X6X7_9FLAO|nr:alpha-E domain-containing protein [Flavivirga amylovorans]MDO5989756.1 alpha-E domain-containing protein [Flavivirga amylovorans]